MSGPITPPLTVPTASGTPSGRPITTIKVSDGDLTISGNVATIDTSGSGGSPGGSDGQVQYNNSGVFGGDVDFKFDGTTVEIENACWINGDINSKVPLGGDWSLVARDTTGTTLQGAIFMGGGPDEPITLSAGEAGSDADIRLIPGSGSGAVEISGAYKLPTVVTGANDYVLTAQTDGSTAWAAASGGSVTWPLVADASTEGAPAYTFTGDTNTGIFSSAADTIDFSVAGDGRLQLSTTELLMGNGSEAFKLGLSGSANSYLNMQSGANIQLYSSSGIYLSPSPSNSIVRAIADKLGLGQNNVDTQITTQGSASLTLSTDNGSNSGTIVINDGVNGDIDIVTDGTGVTEIQNSTTDNDTTLSVKGNGTGDSIINLNNPTKSVQLICDENQKLKVQGGVNTFIFDVSGAATGITWPDGTTQITAASGGGGVNFPLPLGAFDSTYKYLNIGTAAPYGINTGDVAAKEADYTLNTRPKAFPFIAPASAAPVSMSVIQDTVGTGTATIGVYSANSDNYPDTLVATGTYDPTSTGTRTATNSLSTALVGGELYYFCVRCDNNGGNLDAIDMAYLPSIFPAWRINEDDENTCLDMNNITSGTALLATAAFGSGNPNDSNRPQMWLEF